MYDGSFGSRFLYAFEEGQGFAQLRKPGFVGLELAGMDATSKSAHLHGVLEVQHLVVEEVLDCVAGAGWAIKDATDNDGIVGGVVVAE